MQLDAHENSNVARNKMCIKGEGGKKSPVSRPEGTIQGFILLSVLTFAVLLFVVFRASATDKYTPNPNRVINWCFIISAVL